MSTMQQQCDGHELEDGAANRETISSCSYNNNNNNSMKVLMMCNIRQNKQRLRVVETSAGVLAFVLIIICFFLYGSAVKRFNLLQASYGWLHQQTLYRQQSNTSSSAPAVEKRCDLFDGEWVWDDSYPLYESRDCKFIDGGFRCSENGRPDSSYTKWRWQPRDCSLPRFDAKLMLDKVLRGKRVVFVGDSIGRNQWESLLCMLSTGVNSSSIYEVNGSPITKHKGSLVFKFREYNCTVEYYRSPFLVPQGRPPMGSPPNVGSSLKLDYMDWSSVKWRHADILIFNTGHWWSFEKTIRSGCYFEQGSEVKVNMSVGDAYKAALQTVFEWTHNLLLNSNNKTRVFFRTYAPVHFSGGNWKHGGRCHFHTLPDHNNHITGQLPSQFSMLNDIISSSSSSSSSSSQLLNLGILNVTYMTSARKDGHLSLYYRDNKMGPTPLHRQDCSHWCLPGVPDTWNELLYALLLNHHSSNT